MAPTFRSSRSGRQFDNASRARTGQIDHDVFEGLPVRRWARQRQTISQSPRFNEQKSIIQAPDGKHSLPELPMPRDSELLSPASRALLRAARAGCIYIRPAPKDSKEEANEVKADSEELQATRAAERSFVAIKWTPTPRNQEPPEVEFLAKRRSGLPSLYGGAVPGVVGSGENGFTSMRRTKFKRVDPATGNISVYSAWVPEGLRIEGETTEDIRSIVSANSEVAVTAEAPVPGTMVDGVGVVNSEGIVIAEAGLGAVLSPLRRRPPPPKRKGKGIGRGRRKKVMFATGEGADASIVHGDSGLVNGAAGTDPNKSTDSSRLGADQSTQDEEDEEEDGEEGDESDDGDEFMTDSKTPQAPDQSDSGIRSESRPEPSLANKLEESPVPEILSQPRASDLHRGTSSDIPPASSEEKQSEENDIIKDVNMTEPEKDTETHQTPEPAAIISDNPPRSLPEPAQEPPGAAIEQEPGQVPWHTLGTAEEAVEDRDKTLENTAGGGRPSQQAEEQPISPRAEPGARRDSKTQPNEQAEEQKPDLKVSMETEQRQHSAKQPPTHPASHTTDSIRELPEAHPQEHFTEATKQGEPDGETVLPSLHLSGDSPPTSSTQS